MSAQRILHEEKMKLKERDVDVRELEGKVQRLEENLATQAAKMKEYDAIAAQAVKANLGLKYMKKKASVR